MNGLEAPGGGGNLVLALAVALGASIPMWALALWLAKSSLPWRWVAERSWLRWVAWVYGIVAVGVGNAGAAWAYHNLVGSPGPGTDRLIVGRAWITQEVIWILAIAWAKKRHGGASAPPSRSAPIKPTPRTILIILLVWLVLAGVFAVLKVGPLSTSPASTRDWIALIVACGVIASLFAMLIVAVRERRGSATEDSSNSTRRN